MTDRPVTADGEPATQRQIPSTVGDGVDVLRLARSADADRDLLAALFKAEVAGVHGYVLARAGSATLAEDVTGDVFAEAARRFKQGRGDEVTAGWLRAVAQRRLIDRWRRMSSHKRRVESLRRERVRPEVVEDESGDERTLAALSAMPDRQRAALSLRYLDEFSVSEVADALEINYQAAESLLARARRSFAKAYGARP